MVQIYDIHCLNRDVGLSPFSQESCENPDSCFTLSIGPLLATDDISVFTSTYETIAVGNVAVGGAGGAFYLEHVSILRLECVEYNQQVVSGR
jgi:hypothetical protein